MTNVESVVPESFSYVTDEVAISRRLGLDIKDPIRVFTLEGLCVDQSRFIRELGATFADLPWDIYDLKLDQTQFLARCFPSQKKRLDDFYDDYHLNRMTLHDVADLLGRLSSARRHQFDELEPFRRRAIAKFRLSRPTGPGPWAIDRVPAQAFAQEVEGSDVRALKRVFDEAEDAVTGHREFLKLLGALGSLVGSLRAGARELSLTMHQVSIIADADTLGDNSPEGIHKDGADFIVSALVIAREGITGGQSVIYGPDKETEYLRFELQPGQGIFQADASSSLWHDVTPIRLPPRGAGEEGKRDIFGFDIDVAG